MILQGRWHSPEGLINGEDFPLSQLQGKKVLVVNTASKCGFTPQYEGLQELYEEYGGDDFMIIGFPANNFAKQEPGSDEEGQLVGHFAPTVKPDSKKLVSWIVN